MDMDWVIQSAVSLIADFGMSWLSSFVFVIADNSTIGCSLRIKLAVDCLQEHLMIRMGAANFNQG
jgi:hypothetical protein